jgi:RNA polymerase sigma-70 factor (ECF subfamily)
MAFENHLIEKAKNGDRKAFDELFLLQHKYLFNLMYQLSGDIAKADDLAQEAIILAYKKLRNFRCESSFRTWLSRIAINLFRNECRTKSKDGYYVGIEEIQIPSDGDRPERVVYKSELQWCIIHMLSHHLPKKYRIVLILRDLHNMSYKEISDVLKCNIGQVKTNLHRARHMFRAELIKGTCKAFTDNYLCICEGILDL